MSTSIQLAQAVGAQLVGAQLVGAQLVGAQGGVTDAGLVKLGAYIGGGLMLGGAAVGAATGNGSLGASVVDGVARQPEAQGRLTTVSFTYVALVEGAYFINLAFTALLLFGIGG